MVTENVTVRFEEVGARVIKRKIDEIGEAANRATRGIFLLKRAIFVLGGAGLARGLASYTDALTNMENRLRLTSSSTKNLEAVQDSLFASANRSRSSVEATGDIYTRVALSARNLGKSQQDVISVTETLQKAAVISGASAREANAALVQLGQGLASDRLSGDELRSVLEQLPFVADIIVDYLNKTGKFGTVTRGTLRQLGKEGKLTADIIFEAIQSSQANVDALFAQTNPTIEQAFNVARNNILKFIDDFDDATGASAKLANLIIAISENMNILAGAAALVAGYFGLLFASSLLGRIENYIGGVTRAGAALARYADIQVASAGKQVASTSALVNDNRARLANIAARTKQTAATLRSAQAEYAEATAQFQGGRARAAATGQFISMQAARDRLTAATIRLTAAERANQIATARSAVLAREVAAAETAQTAATARLAGAQAAQSGLVATLSRTFPLLTGAIRGVIGALGALWAAMLANPITAIIAVLAALLVGIFTFGDKIKVTADGIVSLKDVTVAAFQIMWEKIVALATAVYEYVQPALQFIKDAVLSVVDIWVQVFTGILQFMVSFYNTLIGTVVGFINGTIKAWDILPAAILDIMTIVKNNVLTAVENLVNGFIEGVQSIPEKFGAAMESISQFASDALTYIVDAFKALPGAIAAIAEKAGAYLKAKLIAAINVVIDALNKLPGISIDAFAAVGEAAGDIEFNLPEFPSFEPFVKDGKFTLDQFKGEVTGAAAEAGGIYAQEFANAYSTDFLGNAGRTMLDAASNIGGQIVDRARKNVEDAAGGQLDDLGGGGGGGGGGGDGGGGKGSGSKKDFASELAALQQKIDLEKQYGIQKEINNQILQIEKSIKRELTAAEKDQVAAAVQALEVAKVQGQILQEIHGPQEQFIIGQQALNQLFQQGAITLDMYNTKLRELQINADKASGTLAGSFRAAIASSIQSASQLGDALGNWVVGAANSAADAIVEFAKTGEFNVRQFFNDLFAQLLKLAAQQILLRLLGSVFGIPVGGFSQGGSILPGFAGGATILPNGPGSTDSQVVAFKKRPDERVDILTPGQQQRQKDQMKNGDGTSGGGSSTVQVNPKIVNVLDPGIVGQFLNTPEGEAVIINTIQKTGILDRGRY